MVRIVTIEKNEKLKNAICYFAQEHPKKKGAPLYQTYLYKFLAFLDFGSTEERGKPIFGLIYDALEEGPVPMDIYNKRDELKNETFEFVKIDENKYIIKPSKQADLCCFSEYEIRKMNELLDKYSKRGIRTRDVNDASHLIRAWKATERNRTISYDDMFENLQNKSEEELTPEEETYLIYKSIIKTIS